MRLFSLVLATVLTVASAVPSAAQTFRAENRVVVTPQSGGLFSVPFGNRFGGRGAWCAAADYAIDVLGASGTSRIYVRVPIAQGVNQVVFGLTPGNTNPSGVSGTTAALRTAGANLSVDHAFQFCYDAKLIHRR